MRTVSLNPLARLVTSLPSRHRLAKAISAFADARLRQTIAGLHETREREAERLIIRYADLIADDAPPHILQYRPGGKV